MNPHRLAPPTETVPAATSRRAALRRLGGGGLAALLLSAAGVGRGRAAAQDATARPVLVGAWKTFVTFADRPPVAGMFIFISDGTLIRTTSDHPIRSPAHGVWEQTGDRDFAFSFEVLVFDEAGAFIETQKIWARLTVDETGDAYTGEAVSNYFDLAGTLLRGTSPARSQGTRMVFEPMPAAAGTPEATPGA